jgi:hypothetical protein
VYAVTLGYVSASRVTAAVAAALNKALPEMIIASPLADAAAA